VRWLKWWWPVLLWGACMSLFSTSAFTSDNTSHFILPFLRWLMPHASQDTLELFHHYIRKCAHFTEYFLLSLLVLRGFRAGRTTGPNWRWALWTVLVIAAYASFDEFHQSFVPGRTALVGDVMIDSSGGIVAQVVAWFVAAWRQARRLRSGAAAGASETVEGLRD
jgi:VanZ family protein